MRKNRHSSYQQAYNAQAVVDAEGSQLILGAYVSQCPSDRNELSKCTQSVPREIGRVQRVLADNGYAHGEEIKETVHGKTWVKEMAARFEDEENKKLYRL